MKNKILNLIICAAFMMPLTSVAESGSLESPRHENRERGNHRGSSRPTQQNRNGNSSRKHNRPSEPSRPGNSSGKPGKPSQPNKPNKPEKPGKPHNPGNPGYVKPGHPGGVAPGRPGGSSYRPQPVRPGSVPPPGYRPYRPNPQHYPNLRRMLNRVIGNGRLINVWQFGPDAYMARYYVNGRYWMQRFYPGVGRYDAPFVVYSNGNVWYDDYDYQYYDDGDMLRVSINGVVQNPWTLIPSFQLNINF